MNGRTIGLMVMGAGFAALCASPMDGVVPLHRGETIARNRAVVAGSVFVHGPTGERIRLATTRWAGGGQTLRGESEGPARVWINNNIDPCGYGDPDGADNIPGTADDDREFDGIGIVSTGDQDGRIQMHWGDVPADTRVNGLGFWVWHNYPWVGEPTIEGLGVRYSFFDGADGRVLTGGVFNEEFQPVASITLMDLPAADAALGVGYIQGFYFMVDLSDPDPRQALTFELGDTDGVGPYSGIFNPYSYFDAPTDAEHVPSGVGLHDFGYAIEYIHPFFALGDKVTAVTQAYGDVTYLYSDTDADGDLDNTFVPLVDNGLAPGVDEDASLVWTGGLDPETGLPQGYLGAFFFGGFECGFSRHDTVRNPHSRAYLEMYFDRPDRPAPCPVDWEVDNDIDIFDLLAFLTDWNASEGMTGPGIEADFTGDEMVDVFDIIAFLSSWNAARSGMPCPEAMDG